MKASIEETRKKIWLVDSKVVSEGKTVSSICLKHFY